MDMERRDFLVGAAGLMAAIAAGGCAAASGPSASAATRRTPMFAYVGCYTSKERNGKGEGVSVYRMDPASGEWTQVQVVKDVVNPSWLTLDHRRRFLYAAHGDGSEATAAYRKRSEEHTSELQSRSDLACRLLLEKKKPPIVP